jgi:hypothetical protein
VRRCTNWSTKRLWIDEVFTRRSGFVAAVCLDGFEGQVLEFGEQAAEFFALSNSGWYSASSEGDRRRVTVLPAIFLGAGLWRRGGRCLPGGRSRR